MKVDQFKDAIIGIGAGLQPDGDWLPTFFLEKDGKMAIIGMVVDLNTEDGKEEVAGTMFKLIAMTNPDAACFISSAWVGEPNPDGSITRPSKHPNRKEAVTGYCMGVRGEADGESMMIGYIQRSPNKPPVITHWKMYESEKTDGLTTKGRFPDAMRAGFNRADPQGHLGRLDAFLKKAKQHENEGTNNPSRG